MTWETKPLGSVVEVLDGKRIPVKASDRAARQGDVPYYGATGQAGWIDEPIFNESLVLLGEDGAPFFDPYKPKAYFVDGPAWVNNHAHVLRATGVDRRYLKYYLDQFNYEGFANGTTRLKLTQGAMKRIPLRFPKQEEQRRIVELVEEHLSHLDAAEAALSANLERLDGLESRLAEECVTGGAQLGDRRPAQLDSAGTADGVLPSLPSGWHWDRLGNVADVVGGVTKDTKKQSDPTIPDVPYLRVANVKRAALDLGQVTMIRVPETKAQALRLLPGDVLMNEGGDRDKLARGWVWQGEIDDCIHQNHVFRARLRTDLNPYFLSWTANTFGQRWAERNGKQSVNLASISLSMIRKMPVVVAPGAESDAAIEQLHQKLDATSALRKELETGRARSAVLRRAVLAAAFSGRLTGSSSDTETIEETAAALPPPVQETLL